VGNVCASVAVNESIFRIDYPKDIAAFGPVNIAQRSNAISSRSLQIPTSRDAKKLKCPLLQWQ
jgi:hypothetical protein